MNNAIFTVIESAVKKTGFEHFGWTRLERPHSFEHYERWIEEGLHGEMEYLKSHLKKKEIPSLLLPEARSALVVTQTYVPHPKPNGSVPLKALPIAAYAKGEDYHLFLKRRLHDLIDELKCHFPDETFLPMTDSSPVLERDLAHRAGLGWFGKNTCLIHPKRGSLFFIGEIFTSLACTVATIPQTDHCGNCTRCLDACPTGALEGPRRLNATKCISYLTIEAKSTPPESLRRATGEWFFGCDVCQTVCPWNEKVFGQKLLSTQSTPREKLLGEVKDILMASNKSLVKLFKDSPLLRAGPNGLKRNAILVAVRHDAIELQEDIRAAGKNHQNLRDLCDWALKSLSTP